MLPVAKVSTSVHDGWGIAAKEGIKGNAIEAGTTTNMDTLAEKNSYRTLAAHGLAVGLSDGLMGNSEVGYVASCSCRSACTYRCVAPVI